MPSNTAYKISADDWAQALKYGKLNNVDPYILVAIGIHETGWGTLGAGRPPKDGAGNILGYGAYDSNPDNPVYGGLINQLAGAANLLADDGVHTIADLQAGKMHVTNGQVKYASADVAPNYPWSSAVIAIAQQIHGMQFSDPTSTAWRPKGNAPVATLDSEDLAAITNIVRQVLNEGTGNGQKTWAGTNGVLYSRVLDLTNKAQAIINKIGA